MRKSLPWGNWLRLRRMISVMSRLRRWRATDRGASFLLTRTAKRGGAASPTDEGAATTMKSGEWRVTPSFSRRARSVLRLRRFCLLSTQFFAANGAATADDLASGFGRHPGPKTVFASVFDLFWLVDSFWHGERYFSRYGIIWLREVGKCAASHDRLFCVLDETFQVTRVFLV